VPVVFTFKGFPSWPREVVIEVKPGATIAEALKKTGVTKKNTGLLAIVNGRLRKLNSEVDQNDRITLYPAMGGG